MAMKSKKSSSKKTSAPSARTMTTETTTTEIVSRTTPRNVNGSGKRSNQRFDKRGKIDKSNAPTNSRAWTIRPHEAKFALPGPGTAVNTNDETWYIGKLRDQADRYGAVPWTAISGDELRSDSYSAVVNFGSAQSHLHLSSVSRNFPSIMVASLIPAIGNTTTIPTRLDMPWMTAAEQKIAYLQSKISGSLPFHAADLVCYWFAAADIFAEIAQAERALKIARTWKTFENISYPRQLCAAMGWDFDSIMGNIRIFEGQIQEVINLANTLLLPKDLSLVERWYFLYSHVFKDSNLPTAKLYGYRKDGYYTFEETAYDTGTSLKFRAAPTISNGHPGVSHSAFWTPSVWFSTVMHSISRLLPGRSTAVVDIMAKLLRAYDVSTFFAYPNVSTEGLEPKFDPEALTAFANLSVTGLVYYLVGFGHADYLDLSQNVDNLVLTYARTLWQPGVYVPDTSILRAWEAKPSVGSLFEMTRLMCCQDGNPDQTHAFMYTGTELVNTIEIYSGSGEDIGERSPLGARYQTLHVVDVSGDDASAVDNWRNSFEFYNLWQRFEYAPLSVVGEMADTPLTTENVSLVADMDNYAILPASVLQRIHRVAIANLWGVQTDFIG